MIQIERRRKMQGRTRGLAWLASRRRVGVLALLLGLTGCGRAPTRAAAGPTTAPGGPPAPGGGLGFLGLDVAWAPPMASAGDVAALSAALAGEPAVTLQLGRRMAGAGWALQGTALVAALSPKTRVAATRQGALARLLAADASLDSPRRTLDEAGRPEYAAPELAPTWPEGQVGRLLAIDDAAVGASEWLGLPALQVGSCEPAMQALAAGQELALVQLSPFLDHADRLLTRAYRARLKAAMPELLGALGERAGDESEGSEGAAGGVDPARGECVDAYRAYLRPYARCSEGGACPGAPRVVLLGGARIAAPEVIPTMAEDCARRVGRDYVAEIRDIGRATAWASARQLDGGWVMLADRLGTLAEVYAALEDICTPRRRRFAAADLAEARRRLTRIGAALASEDRRAGGQWSTRDDALTIAGLGEGRELARFAPGVSSVNAGIIGDARALRDFVIGRSMCRSDHASTPLAVLLADEKAPGGVGFFGYFYEEELICGGLPPLRSEP